MKDPGVSEAGPASFGLPTTPVSSACGLTLYLYPNNQKPRGVAEQESLTSGGVAPSRSTCRMTVSHIQQPTLLTFQYVHTWHVCRPYCEANNHDLWASESQLAFIHILRTTRFVSHASPAPGGKARVQNGASVVIRMPSSNS